LACVRAPLGASIPEPFLTPAGSKVLKELEHGDRGAQTGNLFRQSRAALQRLIDEVQALDMGRLRIQVKADDVRAAEAQSMGRHRDRQSPQRRHTMILHTAAYIVGGAILGFGYHKLVGCRSGACPITANPYISTLYGALMGFLAGGGMGR